MKEVTLYTRKNCGLCEEVKTQLEILQFEYPHRVTEVDIESNERLHEKYALEIPVVETGGQTYNGAVLNMSLLQELLSEDV